MIENNLKLLILNLLHKQVTRRKIVDIFMFSEIISLDILMIRCITLVLVFRLVAQIATFLINVILIFSTCKCGHQRCITLVVDL